VGDGGPPFDEQLDNASRPELSQDVRQIAGQFQCGLHPGVSRSMSEHDSKRPVTLVAGEVADRQCGVIGPDRPGPHQHGIAFRPQLVGVGPRQRAGNPPA